jgi:photosystem II stability/assembly factor-like uncharacterized protein
VNISNKQTLLNVGFSDDKQGWIIGWKGTILRTSDGGTSWIEQESQTRGNLYGLYVHKKEVWAVGADGLILRYR